MSKKNVPVVKFWPLLNIYVLVDEREIELDEPMRGGHKCSQLQGRYRGRFCQRGGARFEGEDASANTASECALGEDPKPMLNRRHSLVITQILPET